MIPPEQQSTFSVEPGLTPLRPVDRITFTNIFSWAHAVFSETWGTLALAALLLTVYNIVAQIITGVIDHLIFGPDLVNYISPITIIHSLAISAPLSVGPIYIAAKSFRGENTSFADVFIGFSHWGPVVLVSLVIQISVLILATGFGIVIATVGLSSGGAGSVLLFVSLAAILFAIGLLYISIRIYFATLLIVDPIGPRSSALDSLQTSWQITSRCSFTLFWTAIVISMIAGITMLAFILPAILYGIPLIYASAGAVYVILTHEHGLIPLSGYDTCPHCNYDLTDTEGTTCPECGNTVPRNADDRNINPYHPTHNRTGVQHPPPEEPPIPLA